MVVSDPELVFYRARAARRRFVLGGTRAFPSSYAPRPFRKPLGESRPVPLKQKFMRVLDDMGCVRECGGVGINYSVIWVVKLL